MLSSALLALGRFARVRDWPEYSDELLGSAAAIAAVLLAAPVASAQSDDYWISTASGLCRVVRATGKIKFVASPPYTPYYGQWWNGKLVIPDFEFDSIYSVDPVTKTATLLSSGGLINRPITVQVSPSNELWVANLDGDTLITIDAAGNQTLRYDNVSQPWMDQPSGLAFDADGILFVGQYGAGDVWCIDPATDMAMRVTDGAGVMLECAAIYVDGSDNLYCADFLGNQIVRVRCEDGSCVVMSNDPIFDQPNDVRVTKQGTILATMFGTSALAEIALDGTVTVISQAASLGTWEGVTVEEDFPVSTGRCKKYGTGLAGTGGFVPDLRAVMSPTIGGWIGLEHRFGLGGASGFTIYGNAAGSLKIWGGTLLVDLTQGYELLPLSYDDTGAGNGYRFDADILPNDPTLIGVTLYFQDLVIDIGAPKKIALSNGLEFSIGS